jgi:hypothetical protein
MPVMAHRSLVSSADGLLLRAHVLKLVSPHIVLKGRQQRLQGACTDHECRARVDFGLGKDSTVSMTRPHIAALQNILGQTQFLDVPTICGFVFGRVTPESRI